MYSSVFSYINLPAQLVGLVHFHILHFNCIYFLCMPLPVGSDLPRFCNLVWGWRGATCCLGVCVCVCGVKQEIQCSWNELTGLSIDKGYGSNEHWEVPGRYLFGPWSAIRHLGSDLSLSFTISRVFNIPSWVGCECRDVVYAVYISHALSLHLQTHILMGSQAHDLIKSSSTASC